MNLNSVILFAFKKVLIVIFIVICSHRLNAFEPKQRLLPEFRKYIVSSIINKPFLSLRTNASFYRGKYKYQGFCIDLLEKISTKIGFNYEIQLVNDSNYGIRQSNGQWNGIIGDIVSKKADLSCADLTITNHRSKVVQFTQPFMHSGITLVTKKPKTTTINASLLSKPFTYKLWCLIIALYSLLSIASFLVSRIKFIDSKRDSNMNLNPIKKIIRLIFVKKDEIENVAIVAQNLIRLLWFLITPFVISVYITGLLNVMNSIKNDHRNVLPFKSIKDLANQDKYKYAMIENGSTESFFKESKSVEYEKIYETVKQNKLFVSSTTEGNEKVRSSDENFIFITEKVVTKYSDCSGVIDCDLISFEKTIADRGYGIATQIGSHLGLMLNQVLLDLEEENYFDHLKEKWWNNDNCEDNGVSLSVEWDTFCGFILFFLAIFISIIFFSILEHRWRTVRSFEVDNSENKILMLNSNGHNNQRMSNDFENEDNKEETEFTTIIQ